MNTLKQPRDFLGNPLSIGDYIVYPTCSSSPRMVGPARISAFRKVDYGWNGHKQVAEVEAVSITNTWNSVKCEYGPDIVRLRKRRFDSFDRCVKIPFDLCPLGQRKYFNPTE